MEENIIGMIAKAEEEAAARKAAAQLRAAEIVAEAEKGASQYAKESAQAIKQLREQSLRAAEERATSEYDAVLKNRRVMAKQYADTVLGRADEYVTEIVGRLTK